VSPTTVKRRDPTTNMTGAAVVFLIEPPKLSTLA
jgi:hypothetical protein